MNDYLDQFRAAMAADGITTRDDIIDDGVIHRFHIDDDKPGSKNGWYVLFGDGVPAGKYGSWKHDLQQTWTSKPERDLTPKERKDHSARMEAARQQRDAETERNRAAARQEASDWLSQATAANDDHPYLQRKKVKAHNIKMRNGELLIPVRDTASVVHGLQKISADGTKLFLTGTAKSGHYFGIGRPVDKLFIAEGYATAATIYEATGIACAVAFDAGNLQPVAQALREKFPNLQIIIAADNDTGTNGNPGLTNAQKAAAAVGGKVIAPADGDFNDLAVTQGLQAVSDMLVAANDNNALAVTDIRSEAERMAEDWVFVAAQKRFVNIDTMATLDVDGFNMAHLHVMGWFPAAGKMKPAEYLRRIVQSRVVHDVMYLPSVYNGDPFFSKDGVAYMNTYNHTNIPNADPNWQQHDAWQICLTHLQNILPNEWEYVLHWMAHNVQHPGEKILWSPIIIGVQGDGKTALSEILRAVMGSKHTTVVGQEAIHSDFNSWAEGSCVVTFEEIRVPGHSRFDFMNKVKPLLTNQIVSITAKGKNQRDVPNTQNYLALSNFRDALVLDDDDRRWAVFFTKYDSREHLKKCTNAEYWEKLYDYAVKQHSEVLRGWLLSIDLSKFDKISAPETAAKKQMIQHSKSSDAQSVEEVLTTGAKGVHINVVETRSLNDALRVLENSSIRTSRLSAALRELKFQRIETAIKWDGRSCTVWFRAPFIFDNSKQSIENVKAALSENSAYPHYS